MSEEGDLVVTIAVVIALAGLSRGLRQRVLSAWFFGLPGVIAHELAHWITALLLGGRPTRLRPWPSRMADGRWALGSVQVRHLNMLIAAPIGLAPLALLPASACLVELLATRVPMTSPWYWAGAYTAAMGVTDAWPSRADWRIALRSWPLALVLLAGAALVRVRQDASMSEGLRFLGGP